MKLVLLLLLIPLSAMAQMYGSYSSSGCMPAATNNYYNNFNQLYSQQQIFNPWAPYWQTYGLASYNNWNSPGAWYGNRMVSSYYPSNGYNMTGFAGKPVIYLESSEHQQVSITPVFRNSDAHLLITSPSLEEGSWDVFVGPEEILDARGVEIPFLYIDYKSVIDDYQFSEGRCIKSTREAISYVADLMRDSEFSEKQVRDFTDYWSVKIPDNENFCIFVQTEKELDSILSYKISTDASQIRRYFVFVSADDPILKDKKINRKIKLPTYKKLKKTILKEWGVVFLAN